MPAAFEVTQASDGRGLVWTVRRDRTGLPLAREFEAAFPTVAAAWTALRAAGLARQIIST